ncbi:MAG: hypothetical protein LBJ80_03255 [Rickettsiales bacterium]|nr:hypothetical protein [Rickettsiales bacterium]MDR1261414.1 hypothetical protein [Rickettsiales bacterium]
MHYTTFLVKLLKSWIPASRAGMTPPTTQIICKLQCSYTKMLGQHFHTISSSTLFSHNAFILTNLVKSWIPVSEHWDDILLVLKPQHCHASRAGMTAKSKLLVSIMICNRSNEKGSHLT